MRCLEREKVFEYVNGLLELAEADEVRAHLVECDRCRRVAAEYGHLNSALDEWKAPEASPWFDARLRAHVAAEAEGGLWGVWGFLQWRRWLLPATVVALAVLAIVAILQSPRKPPPVAEHKPPQTIQAPPQAPEKLTEMAHAPAPAVAAPQNAPTGEAEERAAGQNLPELEDYDLLANFDVLSELPGGGRKLAN